MNWENQYKELIFILKKEGIKLMPLADLIKHNEFSIIKFHKAIPMFLYKKNMAFEMKVSIEAFQHKDFVYNHIIQTIKNYELLNTKNTPQVKES